MIRRDTMETADVGVDALYRSRIAHLYTVIEATDFP